MRVVEGMSLDLSDWKIHARMLFEITRLQRCAKFGCGKLAVVTNVGVLDRGTSTPVLEIIVSCDAYHLPTRTALL